jgi:hypothetical protein
MCVDETRDRFWSKMNFPAREMSNIKVLEQSVSAAPKVPGSSREF